MRHVISRSRRAHQRCPDITDCGRPASESQRICQLHDVYTAAFHLIIGRAEFFVERDSAAFRSLVAKVMNLGALEIEDGWIEDGDVQVFKFVTKPVRHVLGRGSGKGRKQRHVLGSGPE